MPLPTSTELLEMDTSFRGAPFVRVEAKPLDTDELDWSWRGAPFYAVTISAAPADIKIDCVSSAFTLATSETSLRKSIVDLAASTETYTSTFGDTTLSLGLSIPVVTGSAAISTFETQLTLYRIVNADSSQNTLSLKDSILLRSIKLSADRNELFFTPRDVQLATSGLGISADRREFSVTSLPITFGRSVYVLNSEKSTLTLTTNRFAISGDFTRTFLWGINYGSSVKTTRRANSYGKDNYSLRTQDGVNTKKRVWSISSSQSTETVKEIAHFFRENKGVKSFYWTPPSGSAGRWECTSHNITYDDFGTNTISAEFTEVFL